MRISAIVFIAVTIIAAIAMLAIKVSDLGGLLFFLPFALGPQFVSVLLLLWMPNRSSQILLLIGSGLYFGWFLLAWLSIFYWYPDPQGGIALFFIGIYSLPVMFPLWIAAVILRQRSLREYELAAVAPSP